MKKCKNNKYKMIKTFGDKETERLFKKEFVAKFQKIVQGTYNKIIRNKVESSSITSKDIIGWIVSVIN